MQTENLPTTSTRDVDTSPKQIPIAQIKALAIRGLSYREMSKILGCDIANISRRLQPYKHEIEAARDYAQNESAYIIDKEYTVLNRINGDEPLPDKHRAATWSMLLDKRRLISGQSTANVSIIEDLGPEAKQVIQDAIAAFHRQILPRDPSGSDTVDQIDAPSQSGETP